MIINKKIDIIIMLKHVRISLVINFYRVFGNVSPFISPTLDPIIDMNKLNWFKMGITNNILKIFLI